MKQSKVFRVVVKMALIGFLFLGLVFGTISDAQAQLIPADLSTWIPESYPAVSGFPAGFWVVSLDGLSVVQRNNGQPTLFYSDFEVFNTEVEGTIQVITTGDDDYIGFALGFQPWDTANTDADYLLVDWKQGNQSYNFGPPSCTPGSFAPAGLAVSRVFGVPTADEFWGHVNFNSSCSDLNNGLQELARGINLGSTGWQDLAAYTFTFEFSATSLKVYVDGNLEIDIDGVFNNGRFAFYNFSQGLVKYESYVVIGTVDVDIKPGSDPNSINLGEHGLLPIAILGTQDFDVETINPETIEIGGITLAERGSKKAPKLAYSLEDVDGDGITDMITFFDVQTLVTDDVLKDTTVALTLTATLYDGTPIKGTDSVNIVH
jgi:hypothetical protein